MTEPVRFSRLKLIGESAQHFLTDSGPRESESLRKGTGLHSLLLGNRDRVAVYEGRRDPRAKEYQTFLAANEGREILSPRELESVHAMRRSLESSSRAMELLSGVQEQRYDWRIMGRRCRGTPDAFQPGRCLTELKSLRTTNPAVCVHHMRRLAYHAQLAWYREGLARNGVTVPECYVVAVANVPPHLTVVFRLSPRTLEVGYRLCRLWMEQLKQCELSKHWPGYAESDVEWDIEEDSALDVEDLEIEQVA